MTTKTLLTCLLFTLLSMPLLRADHLHEYLLVSAKMDGAQEVPAVVTDAKGVASFNINKTRDTICINVTVTGLSGPITGAHIHAGKPGQNGGVVINLMPFLVGNRITGILTGANATDAVVAKFLSGEYYINIHTAQHPGGEIRGNLSLESDYSFVAQLNGAQENPPVSTNAMGLGVFNLSRDRTVLKFNVVLSEFSTAITGAHLHEGAIGMNGGVKIDLMPFLNDNVISGTIMNPSAAVIDSMFAGKIYINVHTGAHPGGEIRGQLLYRANRIMFDANLTAGQENPPSGSSARGVASVYLNATFDTLWYDVMTYDLTGPMMSAHFHNGGPGVNGPVVINITPDITANGTRVTGRMAISDEANLAKLLRGEMYLNVHTAMFPSGEIRGQVYRLAREGYTFELTGSQEVPPVATSASGSGIVSIDRDQTNAHFMIVFDGIDNPTGAHFHKGLVGMNGPVVFDFTSLLADNAAFGYWNSASATPFTTANSLMFRNDSIYANIHTPQHPGGEIRGQVLRDFVCYDASVGTVEVPAFIRSFELFPNPVNDRLSLRLRSESAESVQIRITDAMGQLCVAFQQDLSNGQNDYVVDVSQLGSALYYVSVQKDGQITTRKFFKE